MDKKEIVIGILGGMGTYATIDLFRQYAEVFTAEKEWERPRIIIDNRCTMPSRVRAFLYNENVDMLVDEMADSMVHLVDAGCNKIILACNTSHLFLPKVYEKVPTLEEKVSVEANCKVKVYYKYTDEDESYYDKEDHTYLWQKIVELEDTYEVNVDLTVSLDITDCGVDVEEDDEFVEFIEYIDVPERIDLEEDALLECEELSRDCVQGVEYFHKLS